MINEQARAFLDILEASGQPYIHELDPAAAREMLDEMAALNRERVDVAEVRDFQIPGPAGEIPARLYVPAAGTEPLPILVYFHGGGWVVGSIDAYDSLMRALANESGCSVVSVDYRLAPEHKFPAAVEDAHAAARWVAQNAESLGADGTRLAVGGDSAGGNLAAVVAQLARDQGGPAIAFQLLVYPATDYDFSRPSYELYGQGHFLTIDAMRWFHSHYLTNEATSSPLFRPIIAESLHGLPPALIICAECDPLHDEGEAYANRLEAEGVATTFVRYPGTIHGFFGFPGEFDDGRQAIRDAGAALAAALGGKPVAPRITRSPSCAEDQPDGQRFNMQGVRR